MLPRSLQSALRHAENRLARAIRAPSAASVPVAAPSAWDPGSLAGSDYCLLVSYRRDGSAAATPMWFAIDGGAVVMRSGAEDGKLRRIRREPAVLLASCDLRGAPLGPPMAGRARILTGAEADRAERALSARLGRPRAVYDVVRAPLLTMAYIAVEA